MAKGCKKNAQMAKGGKKTLRAEIKYLRAGKKLNPVLSLIAKACRTHPEGAALSNRSVIPSN